MPSGNLNLVEVTVRCIPGLVHDSYLSLDGLQTPPEVPGGSDEAIRSYHSPSFYAAGLFLRF